MPRFVIALCIGATINVLIAWSVIYFHPLREPHSVYSSLWIDQPTPATWPRSTPSQWTDPNSRSISIELGVTVDYFRYVRTIDGEPYYSSQWEPGLIVYTSGLPLRSMTYHMLGNSAYSRFAHGFDPDAEFVGGLSYDRIRRSGQIHSWQRLPVRPLPFGFTANTLFYAAILWSPGALKRWRRRRNGKCEECAYQLEGLTTCPECGRAVQRNRAPA